MRRGGVAYLSVALLTLAPSALAQRASPEDHAPLVAKHAAANGVPESLVLRVIKIESGGNPRTVSKGNYGLMQIRMGTAQAMGYSGTADGLLDADMNMTYAVKYLAGAYRAAGGNHEQAIRYYQRGYYYKAKEQGFSPYERPDATPVQVAQAKPAKTNDRRSRRRDELPSQIAEAPLTAKPVRVVSVRPNARPEQQAPAKTEAAAPAKQARAAPPPRAFEPARLTAAKAETPKQARVAAAAPKPERPPAAKPEVAVPPQQKPTAQPKIAAPAQYQVASVSSAPVPELRPAAKPDVAASANEARVPLPMPKPVRLLAAQRHVAAAPEQQVASGVPAPKPEPQPAAKTETAEPPKQAPVAAVPPAPKPERQAAFEPSQQATTWASRHDGGPLAPLRQLVAGLERQIAMARGEMPSRRHVAQPASKPGVAEQKPEARPVQVQKPKAAKTKLAMPFDLQKFIKKIVQPEKKRASKPQSQPAS